MVDATIWWKGAGKMALRKPPTSVKRTRYTEAQWALIEAAAAAEVYPSTYVREASLREARRDLGSSQPERQAR